VQKRGIFDEKYKRCVVLSPKSSLGSLDNMKNKKNKKQCPCCGYYTLPANSTYQICRICDWEDDDLQGDDPDYAGGANDLSLNDCRKKWLKGISNPNEYL
jgi:hypothetical protein